MCRIYIYSTPVFTFEYLYVHMLDTTAKLALTSMMSVCCHHSNSLLGTRILQCGAI